MRACVHQPNYFPWMGFFAKIARCDVFVVMDNVQFPKNCWTNRVRVAGSAGPQWLTVPVRRTGLATAISETLVSYGEDWVKTQLRTLRQLYGKRPHFDELIGPVAALLERRPERLTELNVSIIQWVMGLCGVTTKLVYGSSLGAEGRGSELVADLCRKAGCDTYLAGQGALDYEDLSAYERRDVVYERQAFSHPIYWQGTPAPFQPGLSILDALFNVGVEATRDLVRPTRLLEPQGT